MKIEGNGYTIETEDIKDSDKPQRMMAPIKVSIQTFRQTFRDLVPCKHCMRVLDKSDTTCPHCGEGQ